MRFGAGREEAVGVEFRGGKGRGEKRREEERGEFLVHFVEGLRILFYKRLFSLMVRRSVGRFGLVGWLVGSCIWSSWSSTWSNWSDK